MDYKKKYEDALNRAKKLQANAKGLILNKWLYSIFPELKENEDEKIRKMIIEQMERWHECAIANNVVQDIKDSADAITWLEKQGEQKSTDKNEPKFKAGDFIINEHGFIMQIDGVDGNLYYYHILYGNRLLKHDITKTDKSCHLWTIQDAKDGDVLFTENGNIFIFKSISNYTVYDYCGLYSGKFLDFSASVNGSTAVQLPKYYVPATKEQRNLLFQKMKEAGYEWDFEKKELKKIEQKPNFCHHEVDLSNCSEECRKAYYDGWNNCNQQHSQLKAEQKPTWSEEDEKMINSIIKHLDEGEWFDIYQVDWLKSLKQRIKGE